MKKTSQIRRGSQSIKQIHNLETRTIHIHFSHHTAKHMAGALKSKIQMDKARERNKQTKKMNIGQTSRMERNF